MIKKGLIILSASLFFPAASDAKASIQKHLPISLYGIEESPNTPKLPAWGEKNIELINEHAINPSERYLRVHIPAGSANPGSSPPLPLGGAQFYYPITPTNKPIRLSYFIRFPEHFPFDTLRQNKPYTLGKLPGLYGGIGNTGNNTPDGTDGWSTRFMWCDYIESRKKKVRAGGEVLLFTYGSDQGTYGHPYGTHIGCSNWTFANDNQWHNLQQTIHLNTPGVANGRLEVCYDGQLVLTQNNIIFRTTPDLKINGIIFQTFFGGSGPEYSAPVDTYIDFANFSIYVENKIPEGCTKMTNKPLK